MKSNFSKKFIKIISLLLAVATLHSCISWLKVTKHRADPLLEKIFAGRSGQEIERSDLQSKINASQVIYLCEKHDNPRHHEIQREIISELVASGKRPAIGFEFFSVEQTPLLMGYSDSHDKKPGSFGHISEERLRHQLNWSKRSDEDWNYYYGLVKLAQEHQLPIFGADLSQGLTRRLARKKSSGLTSIEKEFLPETGRADSAYKKLMLKGFNEAHCGWSDPNLLERLFTTWENRNARMARSVLSMLNDNPDQPVVLIVGCGHTAYNQGIYERVERDKKGVKQLNLALTEIDYEERPLEFYLESEKMDGRTFSPVADYLWLTPRVDYEDPCEQFKHLLKRNKK